MPGYFWICDCLPPGRSIHTREAFADWENYGSTIIDKLKAVAKLVPALYDFNELYSPNWALTLHVLKFVSSLFFSRQNEENAFPLGEGMNGKSWLLFVIDKLLGQYACGIQAGVYGNPVPSCRTPNPDWLALMGRKAFLGGEKGADLKIDAGTFKALRDPTNVIELRGLWEGNVFFKSAGRMIIPDNSKVEFKGGVDGGVRRSTLAWPHPWTFTKNPTKDNEKMTRDIKNATYVKSIIPGLLLLLIEIDKEWGPGLISGQILPQPACVVESINELLVQKLDSQLDDFLASMCMETPDVNKGSTPAQIMRSMRDYDDDLRRESNLEERLRRKWHFVSPQNRHRIKVTRASKMFIRLNDA